MSFKLPSKLRSYSGEEQIDRQGNTMQRQRLLSLKQQNKHRKPPKQPTKTPLKAQRSQTNKNNTNRSKTFMWCFSRITLSAAAFKDLDRKSCNSCRLLKTQGMVSGPSEGKGSAKIVYELSSSFSIFGRMVRNCRSYCWKCLYTVLNRTYM